jgi:hypothetical protein
MCAQRDDVWLDERLSARYAELPYAKPGSGADRHDHLLLRKYLGMGFLINTALRHAVAAAQVAAFRHRKPEIAYFSSKVVSHGLSPLSQ